MKNLNTQSPNTRLVVSDLKIILLLLVVTTIASCSKREGGEITNIPAYRTDASQAQNIDMTTLHSNMTLEDRVPGVDYIIKNEVIVSGANLSIKPGVTLMFEDNAGILVKEDGSLTAIGEKDNEIYFMASSGKRGAWKGITILSNSAANVISYCRLEHGGSAANQYGQADIIVGSKDLAAGVEISNSEIRTSAGVGLQIADGADMRGFNFNTFSSNTGYPVSMHISNINSLQQSNQFSGNGKEFIELTGSGDSMIQKTILISNQTEPYVLTGSIVAGNQVIIQPGVQLDMNSGAQLMINGKDGSGSLNAVGTASQPILLKGIYSNSAPWNSITFNSSASGLNQLEYCHFTGGGGNAPDHHGMLNFVSAAGRNNQITVRNCSVTNSAATGIYIQKGNTYYNADIETSNSFSNNAGVNVYYELNSGKAE